LLTAGGACHQLRRRATGRCTMLAAACQAGAWGEGEGAATTLASGLPCCSTCAMLSARGQPPSWRLQAQAACHPFAAAACLLCPLYMPSHDCPPPATFTCLGPATPAFCPGWCAAAESLLLARPSARLPRPLHLPCPVPPLSLLCPRTPAHCPVPAPLPHWPCRAGHPPELSTPVLICPEVPVPSMPCPIHPLPRCPAGPAERAILLDFAAGITNFGAVQAARRLGGWDATTPVCLWGGVSCSPFEDQGGSFVTTL